jgi:hypothetical protein
MNYERRIALYAGMLFLLTFVTSIAALVLYQPVLDDRSAISPAPAPTTASFWARSWSCS